MSVRRRLAPILQRLAGWAQGSVNRSIFAASLRVGAATLVARGAFVARELAIAFALGTSPRLGAFLLAALMPTYLAQILGSAVPMAVVPAVIHARERGDVEAVRRLLGGAALMLGTAVAVAALVMLAIFPAYLEFAAAKFSDEHRRLAIALIWILAPFAVLRGLAALWSAALNAGRSFVLPGLTPAVTPLVAAATILAAGTADVRVLAVAMVLGMAGEAAITGLAVRRMGIAVRPRWPGFTTELRQLVRQFLPMIAGNAILAATVIVDQSMAALISPSSISVLYYASLLVLFPVALAGTTLGTATLPYASQMVAARQWPALRHTVAVYLRYTAVLTVPAAALLIAAAPWVVSLAFYRGAFTAGDIAGVTEVVRYLALQIPFNLGAVVLIQVLSALGRTDILMWATVLSLALKVILNALLVTPLGLAGIGLATSLMYAASFGFLLITGIAQIRRRREESGGAAA